jgi:hypothetical protein
MKPSSVLMALLLPVVGAGVTFAQASRPASTGPSLGDMARQLKEQRAKAFVKPQTVFTNDNLPARPPAEGLTAATGISTTAATTESTPAAVGAASTATVKTATKTQATVSSSGDNEVRDQKYYRRKMKELETQLSLHQRELSVLEQKLSQNQMQYYPDPQKTLTQESTPAFYSDVSKRRSDVDNKKQQIADDEKAMDDLRDQLRREGGDPGWLR